MKVLYVAELVGKAGIYTFKNSLNELQKQYPWDFLIVGADRATGGNGLGRNHAAYIHKLGANVITLGECCFYKKDLTDDIDKISYVLRPDNLSGEAPGFGLKVFKVKATGEKIAVLVLLGQNGFRRLHAGNPFSGLLSLLDRIKKQTPYIIIDFHAQATAEKKTFFFTVDGLCSAVIGSHTGVQTADETILPGGTAVITDAGRTGSQQSVGGCDINSRVKEFLTGIPDWTKDAWDAQQLQGVYLELDTYGKALSVQRVKR